MDVFIATPTYDEWLSMEYVQSIAATGFYMACNKVGFSVNIAPGNPFLDMSRNNLVEAFLASEATDLLFIDADVGWEADKVMRILSHPQEIVGGLVPKRDGRVQIDGDNAFHQNAVTGEMEEGCGGFLFAAKEIPTAFLRIKRSAFERLKTQGVGTELLPWFKIGYKKGEFGEISTSAVGGMRPARRCGLIPI
jgi:hypothetical protein